jgi:hypothetical protein
LKSYRNELTLPTLTAEQILAPIASPQFVTRRSELVHRYPQLLKQPVLISRSSIALRLNGKTRTFSANNEAELFSLLDTVLDRRSIVADELTK